MCASLARRCVTSGGAELATALTFGPAEGLAALVDEGSEAIGCLASGEPLPVQAVRDVASALERLRVGAPLAPPELRDVARTLGAARGLRRFLVSRREKLPALAAALTTDPTLDEVEDVLARSIEPDGTLSDRASERLRALRGELQAARARMVSRLDELQRRHADILSDAFWTEREGRYVLPVRADAHERFPGLVHATSQSGATLFVEPRALIPHGNRLKVLAGEVQREEDAVCERLSHALGEVLPSLAFAARALCVADLRAATAQLALDLDLHYPEIVGEAEARLLSARHPLLQEDGVAVVSSDLVASAGHVVVVSGPNAGGKTVALKTLGLAALMLRAGLPVAARATSRLGVFDAVLTDIGDDQSLSRNLSTFSAHVRNLVDILSDAGPRTLVLLDEVATGTDPREGEALAAAVLDGLARRGAAVLATTHYEGLKTLALADPRFENASVGFDPETMTPTYALALGVPGVSSALAVARRYGLPDGVLERASAYLSGEDRDFELLVQRLTAERRAVELARAAAEAREREALEARSAWESTLARLCSEKDHEALRQKERLLDEVRQARDEVRRLRDKLRRHPAPAELRAVEHDLDLSASRVAVGGDLAIQRELDPAREPLGVIAVGQRVHVRRLGADVEVLSVSGDEVRVLAGNLKLSVKCHELSAPAKLPTKKPSTPRRASAATAPLEPAIQTHEATCDLRGLDVDAATRMAEQFLDRSLGEGRRVAFLVHGHGTGALRTALRSALAESAYVAKLRAGEPREGGDGVTVVWLR